MAKQTGYSGTPLPKKLGIKSESKLIVLGAPDDFFATLGTLPAGVKVGQQARGSADRVIVFLRRARDLPRDFPRGHKVLAEGGSLWLAWPKKSSALASDITQEQIRSTGLAAGLVDYKICAIDENWSGLCFARRKK